MTAMMDATTREPTAPAAMVNAKIPQANPMALPTKVRMVPAKLETRGAYVHYESSARGEPRVYSLAVEGTRS